MKFLDLNRQYNAWKKEFDEAYHRVMESGWYVGGEEIEAFEKTLKNEPLTRKGWELEEW